MQGWVTQTWTMLGGLTGVGLLTRLTVLALALSGSFLAVVPAARAVEGTLSIINVRVGLHPDKTRFVLEMSDRPTFRATVQSDPYQVIVELPELAWPNGEDRRAGQGLIRAYHLERLETGGGRLVLDVAGPVRIATAMVIEPSEGHHARFVLDLASASPEMFQQERSRVRDTSPILRAAAQDNLPPPSLFPVPLPPAAQSPVSGPVEMPTTKAVSPPVAVRSSLVPASLKPGAPASSRPVPLGPSTTQAVAGERAGAKLDGPATGGAATPPPIQAQPVPQLAAAVVRPPVPPPAPMPVPQTTPAKPRRVPYGKPMIALDPGHGGVDPGATGINAIHEKDITLATAREVRRQLEATGRFRVMLTRDEDEFVPLRERVAAARQAGADLFISLHADSIGRAEIRGLSIYTQSDKGSDHEAETLAAKENRADAIGGIDLSRENDQVATILIDLAQRDTRNHSRRFATLVLREAAHVMKLLPKPDRAAAFAVLTAPDVPSVLIEMGYISSPDDANLLTQPQHRQRLAATLVRAVEAYFTWLSGGRRS